MAQPTDMQLTHALQKTARAATSSLRKSVRAGTRWLESTSRSIFGLRMMGLVYRWDEFWEQPDLGRRLATALATAAAS